MLKKLVVGGAALLMAAVVLPVLAQPSIDMTVEVEGVDLIEPCPTGSMVGEQTWEIAMSISVTNTAEEAVRFTQTEFFARYRDAAGVQQTTYDVTVVDDGGFVPGEEVAPGGTRTFTPTVRVSIPCGATAGNIFATLVLEGRDKTFQDGAPFLGDGTPVPLGPTGALGIAVIAGAVGLLAQRFGRRPKALGSSIGRR